MIREITIQDIQKLFIKRNEDVHKGDFGKVGIIGGSIKYSGAVKLAYMSLSSLRSGCGLVKVIVPQNVSLSLSRLLLEQTLYPYDSIEDIKTAIEDLDVLAIGMGWDSNLEHLSILQYILKNFTGIIIIDADGLNTLVGKLEWLKFSKASIVLTPHLKEFSRLTGLDIKEIKEHSFELVKSFAQEYHVILLLKGHTTLISDGVDLYSICYGSAGMATSGSGDVLSGIIAGLLSYQDFNLLTVSAAALLNGLAGEMAQAKNTDIGMIASDTIHCIPEAIKKIRNDYMATFEDFLKLDVRVGTIIMVEDFIKAKKPAYKLEIDFGNLGIKKSSAQITKHYTKEELIGKKVLAIVNFPKKQIADFMSEVLVLGVYSKTGVVLIEPNKHVNNGEKLG